MYDLFRRRTSPSRPGRRRGRGGAAVPELLEARTLLSTISGKSFNDANANGLIDSGESGVADRTIYLDIDRDGFLGPEDVSTTTDGSGNYQFEGLSLGTYIVREAPKAGFLATSPATGSQVVFVSGDNVNVTNKNFGSRQDFSGTARVTGQVYEDLNQSGFRDGDELALSNFGVYADLNSNGQFEEGEPRTVTDSSGQYTLVLPLGNLYQIRPDVGQSWKVTQPDLDFYFAPAFVAAEIPGRTFGVYRSDEPEPGNSVISGVVFDDANNNGINDSEPGIAGRTVYVDANNNSTLDPGEVNALTDSTGSYSLNVAAGTYIVRMVVPAGFQQTRPAAGFFQVSIGENETLGGFDFGSRALTGLTISGTVYRDLENLGVRDPGEPGLANFQVWFDINGNGSLDPEDPTALSGADGSYSITITPQPGFYLLRQVERPGFITTPGLYFYMLNESNLGTPITGQDFGNFQVGDIGTTSSLAFMPDSSGQPSASIVPDSKVTADSDVTVEEGRPTLALDAPATDLDAAAVDLLIDREATAPPSFGPVRSLFSPVGPDLG